MSSGSFFSDAWKGHQFPQAVFNGPSGALPPKDTSGYGHGLNAQADAKINYNSTLLGDLAPYAYGKPGRLSSQTAFLAIPHMIQKVVPVLSVPCAWPGDQVTKLYHGVSDGDLAFTINIDRTSTKYAQEVQIFDKVGALRAIDPFCNLVTVNYLLAGKLCVCVWHAAHCSHQPPHMKNRHPALLRHPRLHRMGPVHQGHWHVRQQGGAQEDPHVSRGP